MKAKPFRLLVAACALAGALSLSGVARAERMPAQTPFLEGLSAAQFTGGSAQESLFGRPLMVWGTSLRVDSLWLPGAGTLSVRLSDLNFPAPLDTLSLLVTDLDGLTRRVDAAGTLAIELNGPARLFFAVFARSEARFTPGLYALTTSFAPAAVPLPASVWLLLSALGGLGALRGRSG